MTNTWITLVLVINNAMFILSTVIRQVAIERLVVRVQWIANTSPQH